MYLVGYENAVARYIYCLYLLKKEAPMKIEAVA